jgi:uncharacterized membrane protein YhaH (DUF805 family)
MLGVSVLRVTFSREGALTMSIPLILGLLVLVVVIAAVAGVWRARDAGQTGTQSSLMLLLVVIVAAVIVWYLFRGRLSR